jgi:hypothetical protein
MKENINRWPYPAGNPAGFVFIHQNTVVSFYYLYVYRDYLKTTRNDPLHGVHGHGYMQQH